MHLRAMTQLVLLLWFLLHLASPSVSATSAQRSGCPNKCGDVNIPYPFGIDDRCAWPGFTISCNDSFIPPRPYLGNMPIVDISLEKGEIRIYTLVAYTCSNSTITNLNSAEFTFTKTFLVAQERNEFTGIGCDSTAWLQGRDDGSFMTGCITTCASLDTAAQDGEQCTGLGCCQLPSIPANLSRIKMQWGDDVKNSSWRYSPCSYSFVAEKGWYKFSRQDFSRNGSNLFKVDGDGSKKVPTVIDWAIRSNGSCSSAKTAPACVSDNSYCIDATNGEGYLCNCSAGYSGNPYLTGDGGCTNINECDPSIYKEQYPCTDGTCHDLQGIEIYTKEDIRKITNNYDTHIGNGAFGEVFKGKVNNNQQVAVKRSIMVDQERGEDFANEINIQSEIRHKNVVRLVGCCLETNIPMLVFEYIPKGSLHDVLHGNGNGVKKSLTLEKRLAIAIGSAEALDYMHSSASQKILHGDVKSGNILLDDCFVAKVSDFGISRLMTIEKDHTNRIIGDKGYIDPVYLATGKLTEKSDVYSFGVVLLELITGKKPKYDGNNSLKINFVKSYMSDSRAREMFDDDLASPEANECLDMIGKIAVQSLKEDVEERPTMKQVLEHLHLVKERNGCKH
ncbi:hypothetical protein GUJ93_ZPchr0011g27321 [Zizania palustris]|uniref:Protein kinase domain-containing protein n=1 Tax=Zizania palustris TaxID=103762 RepID=A0A8J5WL65_ZIZPA|nr:hypothetical protein GUJ93_ZPchr0011g27321 [Zizania palustris]